MLELEQSLDEFPSESLYRTNPGYGKERWDINVNNEEVHMEALEELVYDHAAQQTRLKELDGETEGEPGSEREDNEFDPSGGSSRASGIERLGSFTFEPGLQQIMQQSGTPRPGAYLQGSFINGLATPGRELVLFPTSTAASAAAGRSWCSKHQLPQQ